MPRKAKTTREPRPAQGAHLLALRRKAGLTQTELAEAIGVPQVNIAFWERSQSPPRSDVLPAMAKTLGVRLEDLILQEGIELLEQRSGPVSELQRTFEAMRKLPRKRQRKILEVIHALIREYGDSTSGA